MSGAADSSQPVASGFHEMVLAGSAECSRGLVAGLVIGAGAGGRAYTGLEDELDKPSLGGRLRELVGLQAATSRMIVDDEVRALLRHHAERLDSEVGARIITEKRVESGHFSFTFRAFSRGHAQEVRALLDGLPSGLRLEDYRADEKVDPEATGVEAYSPAHDYEVKGAGTLRGRIDQVIEARRRLATYPLVQVERIELVYA